MTQHAGHGQYRQHGDSFDRQQPVEAAPHTSAPTATANSMSCAAATTICATTSGSTATSL
ncbi:hypothetical protein SAMN05444172_5063 [Burkholderia sp. GAS332]|nr:hypothetical protein SAMN05444172_5063 [Burkholderia sp. GAS332]